MLVPVVPLMGSRWRWLFRIYLKLLVPGDFFRREVVASTSTLHGGCIAGILLYTSISTPQTTYNFSTHLQLYISDASLTISDFNSRRNEYPRRPSLRPPQLVLCRPVRRPGLSPARQRQHQHPHHRLRRTAPLHDAHEPVWPVQLGPTGHAPGARAGRRPRRQPQPRQVGLHIQLPGPSSEVSPSIRPSIA